MDRERVQRNVEKGKDLANDYLNGGLAADDRAKVANTAMSAVSLVVALTVGAIVAAFLLPIGIDEIVAVDTTAWSSGATALWDILDVIIVLAVFLFFIAVALATADRQ